MTKRKVSLAFCDLVLVTCTLTFVKVLTYLWYRLLNFPEDSLLNYCAHTGVVISDNYMFRYTRLNSFMILIYEHAQTGTNSKVLKTIQELYNLIVLHFVHVTIAINTHFHLHIVIYLSNVNGAIIL